MCSGRTAASGNVAFYEAGATLEQVRAWVVTACPAARAHAPPTEAFALKTAPCGPGTSTIKLDESNRLVTAEGSAKAVMGTVASGWRVGTTASATEAAGCVPWEEHGNVEYNAKTEQPLCNVRGTCLCRSYARGREVQVLGEPITFRVKIRRQPSNDTPAVTSV